MDAGDVWNSDGHRISRLAYNASLGLDSVREATKIGHCWLSPVFDWPHSCHGLGRACSLLDRVRRRDSRLPVLRSSPHENIPLGKLSFSWRDRSWNRRHWKTDFTALARPSFRSVHACFWIVAAGNKSEEPTSEL